jgi:hypothetical protein
MKTQAEKIIGKFGGFKAIFTALEAAGHKTDLAAIYRWTYSKSQPGGTGGFIPSSAMQGVIVAARNEGIVLTPEDLDPRSTDAEKVAQ